VPAPRAGTVGAGGSPSPVVLPALPDGLGAASLPSQIAELLEEAITSGELLPGQRLRGDDLAATYGVSRIPVREALRTLEAGGWVEIRPRYGAYVRSHSAVELGELFEVRAMGEAYAAQLAAVRRTPEELAELRRIVADTRRAAAKGAVAELSPLSARFFVSLHVAAHNRVLEAALASLAKRARFYYATVAGQLGRDWAAVHQQIVEAIADEDADTAGALVREHIEHTGAAVSRLLALSEP
jgi:DNA-binding GntR family transcriptional regulator